MPAILSAAEIVEILGVVPAASMTLKPAKRDAQIEEAVSYRDSLPPRSSRQTAWGLTRPEWERRLLALQSVAFYSRAEVVAASRGVCP
jgi:hypothetical protein